MIDKKKEKINSVNALIKALSTTYKRAVISHPSKSTSKEKRNTARKINNLRVLGVHPCSPIHLTTEV